MIQADHSGRRSGRDRPAPPARTHYLCKHEL